MRIGMGTMEPDKQQVWDWPRGAGAEARGEMGGVRGSPGEWELSAAWVAG